MNHTLPTDLSTTFSSQSDASLRILRPLNAHELPFWHSWQMAPHSAKLNTTLAYAIHGKLSIHRLKTAIERYADRHPESQCHVAMHAQQPHFIQGQHPHPQLCLIQATPHQQRHDPQHPRLPHDPQEWLKHEQFRAFDLATQPPSRYTLIQHNPTHHTLIMCFHHLIADNITGQRLLQHISNQYAQAAPAGPPAHWTQPQTYLHNAPAPPTEKTLAWQSAALAAPTTQTLKTLAKQHHTSSFVFITSLWAWYLQHTLSEPIAIHYPVNHRSIAERERPGCYVSSAQLTYDGSCQSLHAVLQHIHAQCRHNKQAPHPPTHPMQHLVAQALLDQSDLHLDGLTTAPVLPTHCTHDTQTWLALEINTLSLRLSAANHDLTLFVKVIEKLCTQPTQSLSELAHSVLHQLTPATASKPTPPIMNTHALDPIQQQLKHIWGRILQCATIDFQKDWRTQGGGSMQAAMLMDAINTCYGCTLPLSWLIRHPTLAQQAHALASMDQLTQHPGTLIQAHGTNTQTQGTMILIHPSLAGSEVYAHLIPQLARAHPKSHVVTIDNPHLLPHQQAYASITAMAQDYTRRIADIYPPPYTLMGWSMGGIIAHQMAFEWQQQHHKIQLILLDAHALKPQQLFWTPFFLHPKRLAWLIPGLRGDHLATLPTAQRKRIIACAKYEIQLLRQHDYPSLNAPARLIKATQSPYWAFRSYTQRPDNGWRNHCLHLDIQHINCHHFDLLSEAQIENVMQIMQTAHG